MKFNKQLREYATRYQQQINLKSWFDYKFIKKLIKTLMLTYGDIIARLPTYHIDDYCCICMENDNLMKTFCCHNYIHHHCMVHTLSFSTSSASCPLCRTEIAQAIKCNTSDVRERFDADVLAIISNIHLNLLRVENTIIKHRKLLKKFKQINYTAVIKITKKIHKYLHIDIRQYFIDIMQKRKFLLS